MPTSLKSAKSRRWLGLSGWRRGVVFAVGFLLLVAGALWIASLVLRPRYPVQTDITQQMKAQAALTGGAKVYAAHCAYCHDKGFGPLIAGRNLSPEAVASFVRMGPGAMQAFPPSQVSDTDVAAVAAYVNGLPPATAEEKGK